MAEYGNDGNLSVRQGEEARRPDFSTVQNSIQAASLTRGDLTAMMKDATEIMPGLRGAGDEPVATSIDDRMPFDQENLDRVKGLVGEMDDTTIRMMAIWSESGVVSDDDMRNYADMSEDDRTAFLADKFGRWMDDPDATGKEIITANMGVQSILGGEYREGHTLDILNIQSVDVLMGSPEDNHVNTFFNNGLDGDTVAAMDEILEDMHEHGDISDDRYYDAAESWDAKTMSMVAAGNNAIEITAAAAAMRSRYDSQYPDKPPEKAIEEYCKKQNPEWNYDQFMQDIADPTAVHGDSPQAYRSLLANGEWPDDVDEQTRDAYNLLLAESIVKDDPGKNLQDNVEAAHDLMYTAMAAGIAAFRGVLSESRLGQKLLSVCNNFVHTPPINGTMFQEIWDLDASERDTQSYDPKNPNTGIPTKDPDKPNTDGPKTDLPNTDPLGPGNEDGPGPGPGVDNPGPGDEDGPGPGGKEEPGPGGEDPGPGGEEEPGEEEPENHEDPEGPGEEEPENPEDPEGPGEEEPENPEDPEGPGEEEPENPEDPEGPGEEEPENPEDPEGPGEEEPENSEDPEGPGEEEPENPEDPEGPGEEEPENPEDPEGPGEEEPENPEDPEGPGEEEPENPEDPEGPGEEEPENPEDPEGPGEEEPENPEDPEGPGEEEPENPEEPGEEEPENPEDPEEPGEEEPEVPEEPEGPGEEDPEEPSNPPDTSSKDSDDTKPSVGGGRKPRPGSSSNPGDQSGPSSDGADDSASLTDLVVESDDAKPESSGPAPSEETAVADVGGPEADGDTYVADNDDPELGG